MSTFLFCPLASQHMPCCSMASPRTTSSQSYPVSSTVSVCLLIAMPHKTCSTPVHSFVCMKHSLSWASLWSLSPVARSWTAPVVEHSMAASDHAWLHSFSMVMPSLSIKLTTTLPACPATEKPVCSMYCTLAHPSTKRNYSRHIPPTTMRHAWFHVVSHVAWQSWDNKRNQQDWNGQKKSGL